MQVQMTLELISLSLVVRKATSLTLLPVPSVVSTLYESGARNFLFQNVSPSMKQVCLNTSNPPTQMVPLDKTPLYAADSYPVSTDFVMSIISELTNL
jgi:hypothetical protein